MMLSTIWSKTKIKYDHLYRAGVVPAQSVFFIFNICAIIILNI